MFCGKTATAIHSHLEGGVIGVEILNKWAGGPRDASTIIVIGRKFSVLTVDDKGTLRSWQDIPRKGKVAIIRLAHVLERLRKEATEEQARWNTKQSAQEAQPTQETM